MFNFGDESTRYVAVEMKYVGLHMYFIQICIVGLCNYIQLFIGVAKRSVY